MHSVTKEFTWDMAHRLVAGYQGKCAHLHGHTYKARITVQGLLDPLGMVIDFDVVKSLCKNWVMQFLNHATVVIPNDTDLLRWLVQHKQKHYVLPARNTTAECLSLHLFSIFQNNIKEKYGVDAPHLHEVTIFETPTSWATTHATAKE